MPPKMPSTPRKFQKEYPDVWRAFQDLAEKCHEAGPLDEKCRKVMKLGLAIGAGLEGGTHSAVRHARAAGMSQEEIEHAVLLAISTIGWPAALRAWTWVNDDTAASEDES